MRKSVESALDELQRDIRQGKLAEARSRILELGRRRRFPKQWIARLANLARQAYLFEEAIRLLVPRVRPVRGWATRATDEERGEYGLALASLGAASEAIEVLTPLAVQRVPWITFGLTLAYFRQWNWEDAIPQIEAFLASPERSTEERLTAEFDLAVALLHGKEDFAGSRLMLERVLKKAETRADEAMRFEVLTLLAQNHFYAGDWKGALDYVKKLEKARCQGENVSLVMRVDLISAESLLLGSPKNSAYLAELRAVRRRLEKARMWNRVRESDYGEFLCTGDREVLWRLYFGSHFPKARQKFLGRAGLSPAEVPDYFDWRVPFAQESPNKSGKAGIFHLVTGENDFNPKARFKEGQVIQRTLQALVMDLYAPATGMQLYERIYPGERFAPTTSMLKVRQSLWQLRQWLADNAIPLEVQEQSGCYWLRALELVELRIPSSRSLLGGDASTADLDHATPVAGLLRVQSLSLRARERYGDHWFSSPDFAEAMQLSERTAQRYLKLGVEQGRFEAGGAGANRRYRVPKLLTG